jgi:hypothetical protein
VTDEGFGPGSADREPLGITAEPTTTGPPMDGGAVVGFPLAGWAAVSFPWCEEPPTIADGLLDAMAGAPCGLPLVAEAYDDGRARGASLVADGAPEDCSALLGDDVFPVEVIRLTVLQTGREVGKVKKGCAADEKPQMAQINSPVKGLVREKNGTKAWKP